MPIATILTPELIERYTRSGHWGSRIWPDYIDATADAAPDRLAVIDTAGVLTYRELRRLIDRLALHLIDLGVKKEQRFGIQLPNWREFILMRFALAKIGAVSVPLPIDWREKEVEYVLSTTEAVGVLAPATFGKRNYLQEHRGMQASFPGMRLRLVARSTEGRGDGWLPLDDMLNDAIENRRSVDSLAAVRPDANEVDVIVPTSGSSAAPKLVVRTPNCFLATTKQFTDHRGLLSGQDIMAGLAPITRGMGYYVGVASPVVTGSTMALLEKFSPEDALDWLAKTKATTAVAVPTQLIKMLQVPHFEKYDLSALKMIVNGGAAIPPGVAAEAERRFGCVVLSAYGSVEGATPVCTAASDPPQKRYTTVGRVMPGMELRIVDDQGRQTTLGNPGEVVYQGPGVSLGFWRNPDAYRELLDRDGWFRTGDLGVLDADGFLTIVGRKKEIIIRGGINISPAEVEGLLQECPGVSQVAVVKMPDPTLGERCCAYIVPTAGASISVDVLARFLDARGVAKYKFPERVEVRDELPLTPDGGKVLKRALEDDITALLQREGVI